MVWVAGEIIQSRVLIIKFGAIGDVLMAIPAAYELHRAGHSIDWVCGRQVLGLLELYPWIRPLPVEERAVFRGSAVEKLRCLTGIWRAIAGVRYELCATLYYDARYRMVALPVRARRKVRLSLTDRTRRLLPGRHHTDEYLRVMLGEDAGPVPVGLAPLRPEVLPPSPLPRLEGRERVVLAPGGAKNALRSDALRRWPLESYAAVARELAGSGIEVVLIGGPEDGWASEAFGAAGVTDLIDKLTLVETAALLDSSDVLVTHDTGPLHLAGITRVGIVSIFGPTDPHGRLPQRAGAVALWGGEGFACRPCYDGREYARCADNACVRQVTPEMVVGEVQRLLEGRRTGHEEPPRVSFPVSTVTAGLLTHLGTNSGEAR